MDKLPERNTPAPDYSSVKSSQARDPSRPSREFYREAQQFDQVTRIIFNHCQGEVPGLFLEEIMSSYLIHHHPPCSKMIGALFNTTHTTQSVERVSTSQECDASVVYLACSPESASSWTPFIRYLMIQADSETAPYARIMLSIHQHIYRGLIVSEEPFRMFSLNSEAMRSCMDRALTYFRPLTPGWSESKNTWLENGDFLVSLRTDPAQESLVGQHNELHSWASALLAHSHRLGDIEGIEKAVSTLKIALSIAPSLWSARSLCLSHLAYAVGLHFDRSGRVSALDEFVQLYEADPGPCNVPQTPFLASNIARIMLLRAQIADLTMARRFVTHATKLCHWRKIAMHLSHEPLSHTENAALELQIMTGARIRLQLGEQSPDIDIDADIILHLCRQHLAKLKACHHSTQTLTGLVLTQTLALIARARSTRDLSYLVEADQAVQEELGSEGMARSPGRADLLAAQADIMIARSDLLAWHETYLVKAWDLYHGAATAPEGRAIARFQACMRWGSHAVTRGYIDRAFEAYSLAIDLLPHVVLLGDNVIGRIEALRQVSGLAVSSVTTALTKGDLYSAVDFLERTRGLIWFQLYHVRAPEVSKLPAAIRDRFRDISQQLESPERHHWIPRRRQVETFAQVITEIRMVSGFQRFLMPPLLSEFEGALKHAEGYAVVIVPGHLHCDVIILGTPSGHSHLRLSSLNVERLCDMSRTFRMACDGVRTAQRDVAAQRKFQKVTMDSGHTCNYIADPAMILLAELWSSLVLPVLEHIGLMEVAEKVSRPRLWWCPVGPLSSLPLHAAGVYQGSSQKHVGRYVVSSYTPTLTALHRLLVHNQTPAFPLAKSQVLLVAQPVTHGCPSLPAAQTEVQLVRALLSQESVSVTSHINGVAIQSALRDAKNAQIIHMACHGLQDQEDALQSGFELQDGRLTIAQLMRMNIPHGRLAYLSACESAGMDESRPDEGLNLVGTMIFVGFRSVIGTMWAMDDIDGLFMAERIYSRIFRDGVLDMSAVPYAVEDAVKELRELGVPASRWATYVHFGM